MFSISIGILGLILYVSLLLVRYRTKWDVNEPGFSRFLHHFSIFIFWFAFAIVAIGRVFPEFDLERIIKGSPVPPPHVLIIENNMEYDIDLLLLEGDSLDNWSVAYPISGDGIDAIQKLQSERRNSYYLNADSAIVKYAIKAYDIEGEIADSLSYQVAFSSFPYRKHYIFTSEIAKSQTKKISPSLIEEFGLLLMSLAGILGFIYHGLRKRRNIWVISGMIIGLLPVVLYCGYTVFNIFRVILAARG